jgi:hypothetical protein
VQWVYGVEVPSTIRCQPWKTPGVALPFFHWFFWLVAVRVWFVLLLRPASQVSPGLGRIGYTLCGMRDMCAMCIWPA